MTRWLPLFLLGLSTPALALDGELLIGSSTRTVNSSDYNWFTYNNARTQLSVSAGLNATKWLTPTLAYGVAQVGRRTEFGDSSIHMAFSAHELALGARAHVRALSWLEPGASAELLGTIGTTWRDGNPDTEQNPTQTKHTAFAPGVRLLAGTDVRIPQGGAPFTLGLRIDLGWTGQLAFADEDQGNLQLGGGFTARTQLGVFF